MPSAAAIARIDRACQPELSMMSRAALRIASGSVFAGKGIVNSVRLDAGSSNDKSAACAALLLSTENRSLAGSDYFTAGAGVIVVGLAVFLVLVDFAFAVDLAGAGVVVGAVVAWAKRVLIARMAVAVMILSFIVFL